ncbi:MAG TPA: metallophosphoesterase [Candidatus Dependentiae bacterium]|nr:metallophosphoesterase [Candidatus Dependentiae bacterium]
MNTRNVHVILSLLSCLTMQGAETPMEVESSAEEQCLVCMHSCKNLACTSFGKSIIDNFSCPVSTICQGLLVLAKSRDSFWRFAIVIGIGGENKVKVHLCDSHTLREYKKKEIRQPRPIWSFIWQPEQPKVRALSIIQSYINLYKRMNPAPFMQTLLIDPKATIYVIGDIHGSSKSVLTFFKALCSANRLDDDLKLQSNTYIIFTGDYTDRGSHGIRVWNMLCTLKLTNPTQVFLIRGNHETFGMNPQNFIQEWGNVMQAYPSTANIRMLEELFSSLPQAVFLGIKDPRSTQDHPIHHFLMFCHGGIDYAIPVQKMLKDYIAITRTTTNTVIMQYTFTYRLQELSGLLWSDFTANSDETEPALSSASSRGECMLTFNSAAAAAYLKKQGSDDPENQFDINALFRGHQHVPGGISRLNKVRTDNSSWTPLQHNVPEYIEQGSVYTCTSSPEGLADFDCFEDSFAQIERDETQWKLTPHIFTRVPKKFFRTMQTVQFRL